MSHPTALASRSFVVEPCAWRNCETIADHPDHPLCEHHFRRVGMMFIHENLDAMREAAGAPTTTELLQRMLTAEPPERRVERVARSDAKRAARRAAGVVYYIRLGDHIKIGTTRDLQRRMHQLCVDATALLATEPGGIDVERERHAQFADEHVTRELLNPSRRLIEHTARLAGHHV